MSSFPHSWSHWILKLVFLTSIVKCSGLSKGLTILFPDELSGNYRAPYLEGISPSSFEVSGFLKKTYPPEACSPIQNIEEINGSIAFILQEGTCSPGNKIIIAQNAGAIAVVILRTIDESLGILGYVDWQATGIQIPCVEILRGQIGDQLNSFLDGPINVNVTLTPDDNEFKQFNETGAWVVLSIVIMVFCAICIGLASRKLYNFVKIYGFQLSVAQIVFVIEIICSLERMIYVIDPYFTRRIWPYLVGDILLTFSPHFTFLANLMINFYWQEVLSPTNFTVVILLNPYRWIILAVFIIFLIFQSASVIATGLWIYNYPLQVVAWAISITAFTSLAIFFLGTGFRIIRQLNTSVRKNETNEETRRNVKKVTAYIMGIGVAMLCFSLDLLLRSVNNSVQTSFILWFIYFLSLQTIAFLEIQTFNNPNETGSQAYISFDSTGGSKKRELDSVEDEENCEQLQIV